jgi:transcription initiation factor IIE alpha subunit
MTKQDLLAHLSDVGVADAAEMANALGVSYATSAMALLRLVRQHLASRVVDPHRGLYTYQLTEHGHARLAFFENEGPARPRQTEARPSWRPPLSAQGDHRMKRKKLHTGTYHCPACFIELELVAEESLKCEQCGGPLDKGDLDEVWADDDEEEE